MGQKERNVWRSWEVVGHFWYRAIPSMKQGVEPEGFHLGFRLMVVRREITEFSRRASGRNVIDWSTAATGAASSHVAWRRFCFMWVSLTQNDSLLPLIINNKADFHSNHVLQSVPESVLS